MADENIRTALKEYLTNTVIKDPAYPLADDEPLITSGLVDSFSLVDLALWVEETFGVPIDNSELNASSFDTLTQLADFIAARR